MKLLQRLYTHDDVTTGYQGDWLEMQPKHADAIKDYLERYLEQKGGFTVVTVPESESVHAHFCVDFDDPAIEFMSITRLERKHETGLDIDMSFVLSLQIDGKKISPIECDSYISSAVQYAAQHILRHRHASRIPVYTKPDIYQRRNQQQDRKAA